MKNRFTYVQDRSLLFSCSRYPSSGPNPTTRDLQKNVGQVIAMLDDLVDDSDPDVDIPNSFWSCKSLGFRVWDLGYMQSVMRIVTKRNTM